MKRVIGIACALLVTGCGKFFEEMPLGSTAGSSNASGTQSSGQSGSGTPTSGGLDCKAALSDCANQDEVRSCQGQPRIARSEACAQRCGTLTAVTCYGTGNLASHGCWCEQTGRVNYFGCSGLSQCVARCGGPEVGSTCVRGCFARNNAVAARLYGALVFCAQNDCKQLCRLNPAQCNACVQRTMAGTLGSCAALSATCAQDRGEQPAI